MYFIAFNAALRKSVISGTKNCGRTTYIHAREYQLYLPSKEELQQKLAEWAGIEDEIGV
ncbi:MAG: hypothetical protein IPI80_11710 [Burkholderiales bacterium]|nr:hypothetical protein [Burkholderiales bacterium]